MALKHSFLIQSIVVFCLVFLFQSFEINKPIKLIEAQEKRMNAKQLSKGKFVDGFTVQLIFTFEKEDAYNLRKRFLNEFDNGYPCEVLWHEPHFKVYAGAFHSRAEALSLMHKVRKDFPNALIVRTKI